MNCSCIQEEKFKFILDYQKDDLVYTDKSTWDTSSTAEPSKEFTLEIINPTEGLVTKVTVPINGSALIPYHTLPISCDNDCYYDGIYTFRIDICQQVIKRTEAILKNVECAYSTLILRQDWDNALKVFQEIEYVKSAARKDMLVQAQQHYTNLTKMIKRLNCNCN